MAKEIEVKVIEINKEEMIKKLLSLGAKKVFDGDIQAITYDFFDNSLKKNESFIRLRLKGDKAFITYKKKISKDCAKIMEEIETEVKDFTLMQAILEKINLVPQKSYNKKRESYQIGDVLFEFDDYECIPIYMEIEAPSSEIINEYLSKLNIPIERVKAWGFGELFAYHNR